MKTSITDRSTSLHHTDAKNSLCVILEFQGGNRWKLSATPIPHGRGENCCPNISSSGVTIREKEIASAIKIAKQHGNRVMKLRVNNHDVELIVKNVEAKMAHAHEIEKSYPFQKTKKKGRRR